MTRTQRNLSRLLVFVCILIGSAACAQQDTLDPMTAEPSEMMKKLAWLAGSWEGEGDVPEGGKYTSRATYTIDLNGHIIRTEYQAIKDGKTVWREQGWMAYHDDMKKIISTTIGIDGTYSDGEGMFDSIGVYTLTGHTAGGTPFKDWRTIITRIGDDTTKTRFEILKDGNYEFFSEETMRRKK